MLSKSKNPSPSLSLLLFLPLSFNIKEHELETQNKVEYLHYMGLKNQRCFLSHGFHEVIPPSSSLGQNEYLPCCLRPSLPISFNTKALSKERSVAS